MKTNIQCTAVALISMFCMNSLYCMQNHARSKYNVEIGENRLKAPKIVFKSSTISSATIASALSYSTPSLSMMPASSQRSIIPHSGSISPQTNSLTVSPPSIICGENHNKGNVIEIYNVILCRLKYDMANATAETKNKKALELLRTYDVLGTIPENAQSHVIEYIEKEIEGYRHNTNDVVVDVAAIENQKAAQQTAPDEHEPSGLKLLNQIPDDIQAQSNAQSTLLQVQHNAQSIIQAQPAQTTITVQQQQVTLTQATPAPQQQPHNCHCSRSCCIKYLGATGLAIATATIMAVVANIHSFPA